MSGKNDPVPSAMKIWCDGATGRKNPSHVTATGMVVRSGETMLFRGRNLGPGTNNTAEILALQDAIALIGNETRIGPVAHRISSDSQYAIKGLTTWYRGWVQNNWISSQGGPVANREIWEETNTIYRRTLAMGHRIEISWVRGHDNTAENEIADQIASLIVRTGMKTVALTMDTADYEKLVAEGWKSVVKHIDKETNR